MPVIIDTYQRFEEVITLWNDNSEYKTNPDDDGKYNTDPEDSNRVGYRRIPMTKLKWPRGVHYEFRCYIKSQEIGIAFHSNPSEGEILNVQNVNKTAMGFCGKKIKTKEIACPSKTGAKKYELEIKLPLSDNLKTICEYMAELITLTKTAITQAIKGA